MSKYTTGELTKMCDVSVRTVQFYDTKGLLTPAELSEGGRRLYKDEDLQKFQCIIILKSMGFSLNSIKTFWKANFLEKFFLYCLKSRLNYLLAKLMNDKSSWKG